MKIEASASDTAVLAEVGRRLTQLRLAQNIGQAQLAERAGVGVATVQRLERGVSVGLTSLIRILRALDRLEGLEPAIPELLPSPLEQLQLHGRRRRRAGSPRSPSPPREPESWRWGDEEPGER